MKIKSKTGCGEGLLSNEITTSHFSNAPRNDNTCHRGLSFAIYKNSGLENFQQICNNENIKHTTWS